MATEQSGESAASSQDLAPRDLVAFEANLKAVEALTQRLVAVMAHRRQVPKALQGPGQDLYLKAASAWMAEAMANPAHLIEQQATHWAESMRHWAEVGATLARGEAPEETPSKDRRFKNPLWDTHPWFSLVKRQYLANAEAVARAIEATPGLSDRERKKLDYFGRQMLDLLAPTNFLATNPDALERAIETDGRSLVDGLTNLVRDLERGEGELVVSLADETAFEVGRNLATTPGEVVFRNRMFELIQYHPTTETVRRIPLLIVPPWINKFYVLDLTERNSLIRWLVGEGFSVFVVSWVNPDPSFRDVTMTTYVEDGVMAAVAEVRAICGTKSVNAVGYCIAGTTLALTLAVMARRKDRSVRSATFLTALTDFSDQGEMAVFLDDDFVDGIEAEATATGMLDSFYMSRTFSYLRSNDLIYAPAIRSYMMGERPPAFDLLYWNGDSTNLPGPMAIDYLRNLCQGDRFAQGGFTVAGETVRLREVKVPLMAVACETDHIAAWKSAYRGVRGMGSKDRTFILSGSGHIAGIVNPPAKGKYGHWTNPDLAADAEGWLAGAERHPGSWWPLWGAWLRERSGRKVAARTPGDRHHPSLGPAPGTYVLASPGDR